MFGDTIVFSALLVVLFGLGGALHRSLPVDTVSERVQPA